jgi:Ca2+-binding RTX toxin-like protein
MSDITGTAGDDLLKGTGGDDDFHLEQGGDDVALGRGGADVFHMGAGFTGADQIDGGGGADTLVLDGDYSAGIAFTSTSMTNVETLSLAGGHSYILSGLTDANIPDDLTRLTVDAHELGARDSLGLDASEATRGIFVTGGAGADTVTGGAGDDILDGGAGHNVLVGGAGDDSFLLSGKADKATGGDGADFFAINLVDAFTAKDKIDGGAGIDGVRFAADGAVVLHNASLRGIEQLSLQGHLDLTLADGNNPAGQIMSVYGTTAEELRFDASLETDGAFYVLGARFGPNTLIGGAGADTLLGGDHADVLTGGGGDDLLAGGDGDATLTGGLGQDTLVGARGTGAISFVFETLQDSTLADPDRIDALGKNTDIIDLHAIDADTTQAGDQAFHLVAAFSGQAGELVVAFDHDRGVTDISADIDGDGAADMVIEVNGDRHGFTGFAL